MPGARGSGGHSRVGYAKKGAEAGLQDSTRDCRPPAGMGTEALGYWAYYAPLQVKRGLLTESSRDLLRSYCQVLVQRDRIEMGVRDSPVVVVSTVVDDRGAASQRMVINPLLLAQRQTEQTLHTLANDLALPPASAIRLPARKDAEADDLDVWGGVRTTRPRMTAVK